MYIYQKTNRYFAQTADDLTDLAAREIETLGGTGVKASYKGIYFTASQENLYLINYKSRLINRILAPLCCFDCHSDRYLYKKSKQINWSDFIKFDQTFAVFSTVVNSKIRHSKYASLLVKDAVADFFRETYRNKRPSVDTKDPDLWINLYIDNNKATLNLDTSGGSLHRRGYRKKTVDAPMIETLAAAIIILAEWNGRTPIYDPFCGSGTFLCECYLQARNIPAAILRQKFGFQRLPDYKEKLWQKIRNACLKSVVKIDKGLISGSDISIDAVKTARYNCAVIDNDSIINIRQSNVFQIQTCQNKIIVCNPPYGIRLKKHKNLSEFYKKFGDFLKQKCKNSTAFIYFGEREYIKNIGLKPSWKKPLHNSGLDGRLVKYELY